LAAPLLLLVVSAAVLWWRYSIEPDRTWQSHRTARTTIEWDDGHGHHKNVDVSPPSAEGDDSFVASEQPVNAVSSVSYMKIAVLLFALLFFGGLVSAIVMLAFTKTRTAGIVLLAIGVPATVLLAGLAMFFVRASSQQEFFPPPVHASTDHDARSILGRNTAQPPTRVPDAAIPVEAAEKVAVKSPKPAAKPPATAATAAGHAAVKATTADDKKPAATKTAAAAPPPLVAPTAKPPAWVNQPPQMLGDTYQMTIVVGPYATPQECEDELPIELHKAASRYMAVHLGHAGGDYRVALPYDFLRNEVVKEKWEEIRPSSVGPMNRLHVLLQFDRKVKDRVLEEYRRGVVAGRLWLAGGGLAAVLWFLAAAYGYLRIDMKTGGRHRRGLRFAAVLAILGPVAVALLATVVK
jgi:hypothetical protein